MELRVDGKRALVTGASSGLGLHFAGLLARAGAEVTLAARRLGRVDTAAAALRAEGLAADAAELDVTAPDSINALFGTAAPFDIVINNAGIAGSGAALATAPEDFAQVIATVSTPF